MTSKQRAFLRALAMQLDPVAQLGKEGLTDAFYAGARAALEKRELVKIAVLRTSPIPASDAAKALSERLACETVQVIGSRIVLYRRAKKNPKIELPR